MRKIVFIFIYLILLTIPLFTIFNIADFSSLVSTSYTLLRLFALYGITLLFIQITLGANMAFFMKTFGAKILNFHMLQGKIAYSIILSHPLLYTFYTIETGGIKGLLPNANIRTFYLLLGETAFVLLTIAVFAAIFRKKLFLLKNWLKFHRLNYIVFPTIIVHSFLIGTDTRLSPFVFLYPIFIAGFLFAILRKLGGQKASF